MDMTEFIVEDEGELRQKERIWDTMNQEYLEQQELKRLQVEEAHKVSRRMDVSGDHWLIAQVWVTS